jgi:hypothetical protein
MECTHEKHQTQTTRNAQTGRQPASRRAVHHASQQQPRWQQGPVLQ